MKLAPELRERIYAFALACDLPILPHLCDNTLKFHDDNQKDHNAVSALLGVTRVSKKFHTEALPMFYAANTFQVGDDTATYFDRLEHLGRFHMIRQVQFYIMMRKEVRAPGILRGMHQYIKAADAYEKDLVAAHEAKAQERLRHWEEEKEYYEQRWKEARQRVASEPTVPLADLEHVRVLRLKTLGCMSMARTIAADLHDQSTRRAGLVGGSFTALTKHPQYLAGGLMDLQTLITLRKLTSMLTSTSSPSDKNWEPAYTSKLVIPLPSADIFTAYPSLRWFPTVCHGLGIHLHVVGNVPLDHVGTGGITVTWRQKWQKKDFLHSTTSSSSDATDGVYKRIMELFPDLEDMPRLMWSTYYRRDCKNFDIRWYSVETEGW